MLDYYLIHLEFHRNIEICSFEWPKQSLDEIILPFSFVSHPYFVPELRFHDTNIPEQVMAAQFFIGSYWSTTITIIMTTITIETITTTIIITVTVIILINNPFHFGAHFETNYCQA